MVKRCPPLTCLSQRTCVLSILKNQLNRTLGRSNTQAAYHSRYSGLSDKLNSLHQDEINIVVKIVANFLLSECPPKAKNPYDFKAGSSFNSGNDLGFVFLLCTFVMIMKAYQAR